MKIVRTKQAWVIEKNNSYLPNEYHYRNGNGPLVFKKVAEINGNELLVKG